VGNVSLPGLAVSLATIGGLSLVTATLDLPSQRLSLFGIGVALVTVVAVPTATVFQFNSTTQSMYIPILGGFA